MALLLTATLFFLLIYNDNYKVTFNFTIYFITFHMSNINFRRPLFILFQWPSNQNIYDVFDTALYLVKKSQAILMIPLAPRKVTKAVLNYVCYFLSPVVQFRFFQSEIPDSTSWESNSDSMTAVYLTELYICFSLILHLLTRKQGWVLRLFSKIGRAHV